MTRFGEALARLDVVETSPDEHVIAHVCGRRPATISFRTPESIDRYTTADDLGSQVAQAISRVMATAVDQRRKLITTKSRLKINVNGHADAKRRRFHADRDSLPACGFSPNDVVEVGTSGLSIWDVEVESEAFVSISPGAFCAEVNAAIREAHRDFARQEYELKKKYFDIVGPQRSPEEST